MITRIFISLPETSLTPNVLTSWRATDKLGIWVECGALGNVTKVCLEAEETTQLEYQYTR
jgi:hypothetical protein